MRRRNRGISRARRAQTIRYAILHLIGGFMGDRNGENLLRPDLAILDQVSHAVSNDPRLAASRSRENQHGAFGGFDSFELFRVEQFGQIHTVLSATKGTKTQKLLCIL